jgi:hypothetical protein
LRSLSRVFSFSGECPNEQSQLGNAQYLFCSSNQANDDDDQQLAANLYDHGGLVGVIANVQ